MYISQKLILNSPQDSTSLFRKLRNKINKYIELILLRIFKYNYGKNHLFIIICAIMTYLDHECNKLSKCYNDAI